MASYVVHSPYVTLKVRDANGASVVQGFYKGGIVVDPEPGEVLDKHLRNGWVEKVAKGEKSEKSEGSDKEPTVQELLDEVGDDKDKAAAVLEQEKAGKNRKTLVEPLEALLADS